ncbi:MAG: LPXTG cell wall anchor domain-containing protein [Lachnospiraceae bacterium]
MNADVVNNKGSELPSTGGMGTTIFYVIGSILVLGAAILLITKKRMSAR